MSQDALQCTHEKVKEKNNKFTTVKADDEVAAKENRVPYILKIGRRRR